MVDVDVARGCVRNYGIGMLGDGHGESFLYVVYVVLKEIDGGEIWDVLRCVLRGCILGKVEGAVLDYL